MLNAFWECRQYLLPQWQHCLALLVMYGAVTLVVVAVAFLSEDLLTNKLFLGNPLTDFQALFLFRDPAVYVNVDQISVDARLQLRTFYLISIALLMGLMFFLSQGMGYYQTWILQRINQHLREVMMRNAVQLSLRYHSKNQVGDAIYRVFQDSAMVTAIIETGILNPIMLVVSLGIMLGTLFAFDPYLALLVLLAFVPSLLLMWYMTNKIRRLSRATREANSTLTSHIQESVQGTRVLKALVAEQAALQRFNTRSHTALDRAYELRRTIAILDLGVYFFAAFFALFADYITVNWVWEERETFGYGLIAFLSFAVWNLGAFRAAREQMAGGIGTARGLANTWSLLQDMGMGLQRALFLLHVEPEVQDRPQARDVSTGPLPIEFDLVSFAYEPGQDVLTDISFTAEPGTITAIVGGSGAGKSTLMNLLLRLYDVGAGKITVGNDDVRDLRQDSLRTQVAMVLQENVLFPTSIRDNICYAAPDTTDEMLSQAIHISCVDEFLDDLPEGLGTELGERGAKLSTGQRQRISIARALVKDAPVLVLDEPTAALDVQTEQRVLDRIREWSVDKVVLLITHRVAQAIQADKVVYLEGKTIAEQGDPTELLTRPDGRFYSFVQAETTEAA